MDAGDLKLILKNVPNDTPILITTGNFEQGHNTVLAQHTNLGLYLSGFREFRDAYDGTTYRSTVYFMDPNGKLCMQIFA